MVIALRFFQMRGMHHFLQFGLGQLCPSVAGSLGEPADDHVAHWREVDADERHADRAAEYGDAQGRLKADVSVPFAGARRSRT